MKEFLKFLLKKEQRGELRFGILSHIVQILCIIASFGSTPDIIDAIKECSVFEAIFVLLGISCCIAAPFMFWISRFLNFRRLQNLSATNPNLN